MIALATFFAVLGAALLASLLGRRLRRMREQQTRSAPGAPVLYVVRDEQLDIRSAQRRSR